MSQFLGQIFTLLTTPPGNLIYHLILAFSIAGALQWAVNHWRTSEFPQARRTVFGLGLLLLLQLGLFLTSGLAWQGFFNPQTALPPLDRAITLLSLIWITWLWAFPEPVRLADAATVLLNLLVGTVLTLTVISWLQRDPGATFNQTLWETVWQLLTLATVAVGTAALVIRRPNKWGNGLSMLGLAFLGHLVYLLLTPPEGNFPGVVRLMQMITYPILLTLPQRFPYPAARPAAIKPDQQQPERRRYSTDPKTFHALLSLASELDADKISHAITRVIAQSMLADLCFLIYLTEDKNLSLACGYDLIREENLEVTSLDKEAIPLLANAIQRGRPLRLPASSTSSDLKGLGQLLGLSSPGHLLSVPIVSSEHGPLGGILLLSPYSNRLWSVEDQTFLTNVSANFVPIIQRGQRMAAIERQREEAQGNAQTAQEQTAELQRKYDELSEQFEAARQKIVESQLQADNLAALHAVQEELQQTITQLQAENEQLCNTIEEMSSAPPETQYLESELRLTLEEVARLQNVLAESNMKVLELEKKPTSPLAGEQAEVIASISQELRQPMSSIVGYTDLLLGESVGILGALQRKFLERIKTSTERIGGLVDDLIQITTLEAGQIALKPKPIDLNLIIDNAVAYTSTQLREKNITLRLDIPETSPQIQVDRESLQQMLIHLLQNASTATLVEGTITLRVQMQEESQKDFLLIQVTDTGGGIPEEDIPRVFARRYQATNVLIQGLGDTGVGLSIARSLVEAQNGRIWVETEMGEGSTFSILLPVTRLKPEQE